MMIENPSSVSRQHLSLYLLMTLVEMTKFCSGRMQRTPHPSASGRWGGCSVVRIETTLKWIHLSCLGLWGALKPWDVCLPEEEKHWVLLCFMTRGYSFLWMQSLTERQLWSIIPTGRDLKNSWTKYTLYTQSKKKKLAMLMSHEHHCRN